MANAYLPLLSCTARDALIAACILPFNHTHSVLPTLRRIESCNQNMSIALVNQSLPYRTRRPNLANALPIIREVQATGHPSYDAIAGQLNARRSLPRDAKTLAPHLFLITSQFCENGLVSAPPFLLRPSLQNARSLPDRYPDPRPVLDGVGKDFLRLAKIIAGV